ncbi:signal recognition particle protein [Flammeovirga kamogawensis]|uniref:Signal recognition particle protein n=1 Tax=Flammeovirga kamogawensis TaxID=373891 RepID=A0ABX8GWJ3_9BACT|nr:signal recognition particle protein [Flammeovirga kamogawensis]MBB6460619.1 signal recognition particle subunit SRP54 [Flammeovirga kamogawensis]QWG07974.1 signal recognition particle protein [Flammeovirga kamogawensis]TRX69782.1 signal recognition particle protein [Flammeovirga kamogawensis]
MFDNLSNRIDRALKNIKGEGSISEINVASTVKEIRRALLEADVNFKVAKEITNEIREQALGQNILIDVKPGQLFTKIVSDKLTELMGGDMVPFTPTGSPATVLIAGLQGSGKTTFTGKLGLRLKKQGKQVLLVAADVYRPAAIDQLETLGEQTGVEVYTERENKNPVSIAENAIKYAKENGKSIVVVDTAGRLAVDEQMMNEIEAVKKAVNPSETLFVVDSMTGQDAVNTAKTFNDRLDFDGVVLTKLDGDTRGGAALSIRRVVEKPIKFISTGEKLENTLDEFYPERMAQRILGMGDVVSLVERAQEAFDEEEARRLNKKLRKNQFDFNDLLSQIQHIKKMGDLKDLIGMVPGLNKMVKDQEIDSDAFKPVEAIIQSMTPYEKANPDSLDQSRKKRLAAGSGTSVQQVNNLIKQFEEMRKMMRKVNKMSGIPGMGKKGGAKGGKKGSLRSRLGGRKK